MNLFFVFGFRIIQKILTVAAMYFFVRAVDQESFGEYNLIITLISVLSIFSLPGLGNALMQSVARGYKGTYRFSIKYTLGGSLIITYIMLVMAAWYWNNNNDLALGLIIGALTVPGMQGLNYWKNLYKGIEDFKTISRQGVILSFLRSTLMIVAVLTVPDNYLLPLLIFIGLAAIQNVYFTLSALKKIAPDEPVEQESFRYGIKTTTYSIFNTIANHIDKILVFYFLSPAALAVLVVADKLPEMIKALIQDLGTVLAPRFAKHKEYDRRTDKLVNLFSLAVGTCLVAFAFIAMPLFITLIFGEGYNESIPYAQALLCSVAIGNAAQMRARYISSKLDAKSFKEITVIMSVTRIMSSLVLVPLLGLWGAIISTFIYRIVMTITVYLIMRKRYLIPS